MLTTAILSSYNCSIMLQKLEMYIANAVSAPMPPERPIIVWDIVNYRGTQTLKMRCGWKVCKKWWDGSWMQAITQKP